MRRKHIIFLLNLLQDVNIIRPLAVLASRELDVSIEFLVSYKFLQRDKTRSWQNEIALLCANTGAKVFIFSHEYEAEQLLSGKSGIIFAASESSLSAHADTHNIFRLAPKGFLKITLQHGFECVGFLQNREHNKAHGTNVTFAADVVCGWFGPRFMMSMALSERAKLYVSGPPSVLQELSGGKKEGFGGLVCENLHSVRLSSSGDFKASFMDIFSQFCEVKAEKNEKVFLRPHPGGQYVVKNNIKLPNNVELNNRPIYKVKLNQFDFGISAPSSIIIDMILANIPVGVWRDVDAVMDTSNYSGLTQISTLTEWVSFANQARKDPATYLKRQNNFLDNIDMPTQREDVQSRFLRLMAGGTANPVRVRTSANKRSAAHILFVAMDEIPTYQLSFLKPLKPLIESGDIVIELLKEETLQKAALDADALAERIFERFSPDILVFCRYSGPGYAALIEVARQRNCPTVYHVDDDLLNIPVEIGLKKFNSYNRIDRLESINYLLEKVDLVYCSTPALKQRYQSYGFETPMVAGQIYCSAEVKRQPKNKPLQKIGYMGFDHAHDLELILPPLVTFLRNHPEVTFELFGSIPKPAELNEFGERIKVIKPIRDYAVFMKTFSDLGWDIGLCPLQKSTFNEVKANTKWVEYSSIGAAVIASANLMYDESCSGDCGLLADSPESWLLALERFYQDNAYRTQSVLRAQAKLKRDFSESQLRQQIFSVFKQVQNRRLNTAYQWPSEEVVAEKRGRILRERILVAADAVSATQEISFRRPLSKMLEDGQVSLTMIGDSQALRVEVACRALWNEIKPTVLFLSRFGDVLETHLIELAREDGIPIIFHIDDNLLRVSRQLGYGKFKFYNDPARKAALRDAINSCDLLYASTETLGLSLAKEGVTVPIVCGKIYCSIDANKIARFKPAETPVIGYMGTGGHAADMASIMPAIVRTMIDNPDLRFETFGTIEPDPQLLQFGDRFKHHRRAASYDEFIALMGKLGWWAGLAPLEDHNFNLCKANTKWVEYSLSGIATIASDLPVYQSACDGNAGLLAGDEQSWYRAMRRVLKEKALRRELVDEAQTKLKEQYTHQKLTEQIMSIIHQARNGCPKL
ncbi:hypothetical protein MMA231_03463 (plasmid) [Asticcacaulis sp. MM231]|uniref:glycosyltransferase n=1 Tax=Asticcacaulis sp. MM231 TaxID=3157666 RepID=UPI0032D59C89